MPVEELLTAMRTSVGRNQPVPDAHITAFVRGVVQGTISRPQAAAWLAWAFARGLSEAETTALTTAMTASGDVLAWPEGPVCIDKHSTGGVGDKVSLILAPLWAALGKRVPMISGRGLGHTGGTLDKLEAIPGYRTDLSEAELRAQLADVGCFITGQTAALAPADRVLYALRNEISAVESIPLIVGSILSKKLAEGVQHLVLDVKAGSGAFMKTTDDALRLATALQRTATAAGVICTALVTDMDQPLGQAVGNGVEVTESVACLQGGGPADLRELVLALADDPGAAAALDDGRAYACFERMVAAQGGDVQALRDPAKLHGTGVQAHVVLAPHAGVVHQVNAFEIGRAVFVLGAGRRHAADPVDMGVGAHVHVRVGDVVEAGQPMVTLLHRDGRALESAVAHTTQALALGNAPVAAPLMVRHRLTS